LITNFDKVFEELAEDSPPARFEADVEKNNN